MRHALASVAAVAVVLAAFGVTWAAAKAPACPRRPEVVRAERARSPRVTIGEPHIVVPGPSRIVPPRARPARPPSVPAWRCRWHDEEQGIRACESRDVPRS